MDVYDSVGVTLPEVRGRHQQAPQCAAHQQRHGDRQQPPDQCAADPEKPGGRPHFVNDGPHGPSIAPNHLS